MLLHFACDDAKLNIADLFVSQCFGDQLVDRVAFGQGYTGIQANESYRMIRVMIQ